MSEKIRKIVVMAMLVAVSIVLVYLIHFPIFPSAAFLEYDPADIPILIGAFAYGPVAGLLITVVAAVIQGLTVSAGSGLYGVIMHIIATGVLVLVAASFAYYFLMQKIHFIAATVLYLLALFLYLGERTWWKLLLLSVITTGAIYVLFGMCLNVRLP